MPLNIQCPRTNWTTFIPPLAGPGNWTSQWPTVLKLICNKFQFIVLPYRNRFNQFEIKCPPPTLEWRAPSYLFNAQSPIATSDESQFEAQERSPFDGRIIKSFRSVVNSPRNSHLRAPLPVTHSHSHSHKVPLYLSPSTYSYLPYSMWYNHRPSVRSFRPRHRHQHTRGMSTNIHSVGRSSVPWSFGH